MKNILQPTKELWSRLGLYPSLLHHLNQLLQTYIYLYRYIKYKIFEQFKGFFDLLKIFANFAYSVGVVIDYTDSVSV